uniref:Uncharacterized protein n=1 Tax=Magnetococcus massalia (strain MO-1) TaxID=451514 RepID=A0A1S7LGI6_MAGMO|nr:exported protein of unknown function [Candidatus Magnetococcus massalia]
MIISPMISVLAISLLLSSFPPISAHAEHTKQTTKQKRIMVVSSYHKSYRWSQNTQQGLVTALLELGYLDTPEQGEQFTRTDQLTTPRVVLQKMWLDSKHKNSPREIAAAAQKVIIAADRFKPDLMLLGDDNAANLLGNYYLDTDLPIIFWGVNVSPMKYGLLDDMQHPGHNVTGVYQTSYIEDGLRSLQKVLPHIKRVAVLSDSSPTARPKAKKIYHLQRQKRLPVEIVKIVVTKRASEWKAEAEALLDQVDGYVVLNHSTLKDDRGRTVPETEITRWFTDTIPKPSLTDVRYLVEMGLLAVREDSGFKQSYRAMKIAHEVLHNRADPAQLPAVSPEPGQFLVNRERARALGLEQLFLQSGVVEGWIDQPVEVLP